MDKFIFSAIEIAELQALIASTVEKAFHKINQGKTDKQADTERWMNLDEFCQYHPDKPTKPTVYGWVHAGIIPFHKGGKKLRFLKSDIDRWLMQGRKQTTAEVDAQLSAERDSYLLTKRKGGKS